MNKDSNSNPREKQCHFVGKKPHRCAEATNEFQRSASIFLILTFAGARSPLVILRSLAMTIPSLAKIPTHVPALLIASMAYSTCHSVWEVKRAEIDYQSVAAEYALHLIRQSASWICVPFLQTLLT